MISGQINYIRIYRFYIMDLKKCQIMLSKDGQSKLINYLQVRVYDELFHVIFKY